MKIWKTPSTPEILNQMGKQTMSEHIGIVITEVGDDFLEGTMPVDARTVQPYRVLHGGASLVLAETLGSIASSMCINLETQQCFGMEINANHLRPALEGSVVRGVATAIHIGKKSHVWDIKIYNSREQLLCISRLTVAVVEQQAR